MIRNILQVIWIAFCTIIDHLFVGIGLLLFLRQIGVVEIVKDLPVRIIMIVVLPTWLVTMIIRRNGEEQ